ncbi:hypothetical protein [Kitasatospora sp. NPDC096204]|uniref:hypothetical protein n=1 Tax=Kitasatospora sp. NPDC096204 TaxID=3364094 RepID=UPI0038067B50
MHADPPDHESPSSPGALSVEDLVDQAADTAVRTGDPAAVQALLDDLDQQGADALWEGALVCLAMLSSRPVYGRLDEYASVARLRQAATATPDRVTSMVLELLAVHREFGVRAARLVWEEADEPVRSVAVVQLLITMCAAVGTESGRLSAPHMVRLVKQLVIGAR